MEHAHGSVHRRNEFHVVTIWLTTESVDKFYNLRQDTRAHSVDDLQNTLWMIWTRRMINRDVTQVGRRFPERFLVLSQSRITCGVES